MMPEHMLEYLVCRHILYFTEQNEENRILLSTRIKELEQNFIKDLKTYVKVPTQK